MVKITFLREFTQGRYILEGIGQFPDSKSNASVAETTMAV
jgi:hypothetical protein